MSTSSDDPVLAKSTFLTSYMSQHSDTLVAYILHDLQTSSSSKSSNGSLNAADIKAPRMLKISSKSMELQYNDAKDGMKVKKVEIPFDPSLAGYEEVRPRLLQMKLEAESAIGMAKQPTISIYRLPTLWNAFIVISLLALWIGCATQEDGRGTFSRIRKLAGGWWTIRATGLILVTAHAAEAAFQFLSCRRFKVPFPQTIMWTITTFFLGFASLLQFRQVVREARIASVDKAK